MSECEYTLLMYHHQKNIIQITGRLDEVRVRSAGKSAEMEGDTATVLMRLRILTRFADEHVSLN